MPICTDGSAPSAVLFGKEDILINNIAWALRYLPFFGLYGDG
jgi:NADH dehydrogenase